MTSVPKRVRLELDGEKKFGVDTRFSDPMCRENKANKVSGNNMPYTIRDKIALEYNFTH